MRSPIGLRYANSSRAIADPSTHTGAIVSSSTAERNLPRSIESPRIFANAGRTPRTRATCHLSARDTLIERLMRGELARTNGTNDWTLALSPATRPCQEAGNVLDP